MRLKEFTKKLIQGKRYSSDTYISYLRNIGVKIGEDCTIYVPTKTLIDEQYPWMITIGDHVRITEGVKILTHDYSWSVLKTYRGGVLGSSGRVTIGDNVFIGMDSIITAGVQIGDNVVIGTGAVVTKDCESNSVYVGCPAKKIMGLEEFYDRRCKAQLEEAKDLALAYFERFGHRPDKEVFHEYFMLFCSIKDIEDTKVFSDKMDLCMNRYMSMDWVREHKAVFDNYDEFLKYCFREQMVE